MAATIEKPVPPPPAKTAAEALRTVGSARDAGLSKADAETRLAKQGPDEVPEKRSHPTLRLAKKFWGLSAWMIELIAVLSFSRRYVGRALAAHPQRHPGLLPGTARIGCREGVAQQATGVRARSAGRHLAGAYRARELVTGDIVRVRTGDFVPADVQVFDGALRVDQSALTSESKEVDKKTDDAVYAGTTVRSGEAMPRDGPLPRGLLHEPRGRSGLPVTAR